MPVLRISNGEGQLTEDAGPEVLSAMLAPNDEDFWVRHRVVTDCLAHLHAAMEDGDEAVAVPVATFGVILTSPPAEELQREALERFSYGELAGFVLGLVVICGDQHPEHASVSKAVEALEAVALKDGKMPDGSPLPRSRSFLMRQWSAFKPVAHLYAAWEALFWDNTPRTHPAVVFQDENLLALLAVSEYYRQKAEAIVVKHRRPRETLLTTGEVWQPPSDLQLPEIRFEEMRIPDEVLEAMAKYRAPKKF